jgi:methylenetetrahydrofolate reductase (NADPH)
VANVPAEVAVSLAELVRSASLETAVKNIAEVDAWRGVVPAGTHTYIPWLPAFPWHHQVAVGARLRAAGFVPVPHVAARRLPDAASAGDLLARLAGEAGVDSVLLIGGDVDKAVGPYDSAAALLRTGLLERHGIRHVGLAGYPEGHPKIPQAALREQLAGKIALTCAAGLQPFVVSQFCFEAEAIVEWLQALRRAHADVPVRIGLAGPASIRTLIAYGTRCGVGASLRAIKSQGISLTRLVSQTGPEDILEALARARLDGRLDDRAALHFFSFGGVERTTLWAAALTPRHSPL